MTSQHQIFRWALTAALLLNVITARAADSIGQKKPIEFRDERPEQEQFTAVPLDAEVYAVSSDQLTDLRILDSTGLEVPFRILKLKENRKRTVEKVWPAKGAQLKPSADGLEIRFSLQKDDPQPGGLRITTPLNNFEQAVRVYGVAGDKETLLADDVIFDYSKYMDVRRVDVPLPVSEFRTFRVVVEQPTSAQESQFVELTRTLQGGGEQSRQERFSIDRRPFRIDRIELRKQDTRLEVKSIVEQRWDIDVDDIREDRQERETVVEFSTQRQPLTRLQLLTSSLNFGRHVRLEVPVETGIRTEWKQIAGGTLSRLKYQDIDEQHLELTFPETRSQVFRLVVENQDSPPLKIDGLNLSGHVDQLFFMAQPKETYELHFGFPEEPEQRPDYDTMAIDRFLSAGVTPVTAQLGAGSGSDRAAPVDLSFRQLINSPVFLGILVATMALLLAWGLYGAVKRVDAVDDSP